MITIVATVGASANSYATLAEAQSFIDTMQDKVEGWSELETEKKNRSLVQAARLLARQNWKGVKSTSTDALRWPRSGVVDLDGYELDDSAFPDFLKEAQSLLAYHLTQTELLDPADKVKKVKAGSLEVEFELDDSSQMVIPDSVTVIIRPYVNRARPRIIRG